MDFFDVLLQAGLVTSALVAYLVFLRKQPVQKGDYRLPGWNYPLKLLLARYAVSRWKYNLPTAVHDEKPHSKQYEGWDSISVRTTAPTGVTVLLGVKKLCGRQPLAEVTVFVRLQDGTAYRLQQHPDTAVGAWLPETDGWRAGGLKIQILEPQSRLRILFNGLLTRVHDNVTQHVKFNFIWASVSKPLEYPKDWSSELAGEALALEPWRNREWSNMLGKWEESSWLQWGTVQGRFQSYTTEGGLDISEYLETRGTKERYTAPHAYEGLRRSITITAAAKDGTAIMLRGLSYKNALTQCITGCVRLPDYRVQPITYTDLAMPDFCESPDGMPEVYTINVSTKERSFKLVLRIPEDGGKLHSGVPYQQDVYYRSVVADIDKEAGAGLLELGYPASVISQPLSRLSPAPLLKWLEQKEAGPVGYCVSFEDRASRCTEYVGGKGASLALLASVQHDEKYKVPPGFCITVKALEKHLEQNPSLKAAILEIETATVNYDETQFKQKCQRASSQFGTQEISAEIKNEILTHLADLRSKSADLNLGPELRFAVRSSAIGEDSEALSAAGQNDTILGCVTDDDVVRAVQKCWGSVFAFTSAYYRRQNGQPCMCGAGVVVQTLVSPRTAGVMFTRQPDHGDPSRILITANYGLGESVVSGSVEPDTMIVKRELDSRLTILKTELGSKTSRVTAASTGVTTEDVPEQERGISCLNQTEILKLAQLGASQDELWGAGRDIEWAICEDQIYLLQARPITSLERWTEEELLHELDFPIMSDDELTTFGNTGEVLPKPITALSHDIVISPLSTSMDEAIITNGSGYDKSVIMTNNRCIISLYNSVYRRVTKKLDTNIRMTEMAINGHKIADESILQIALHRRKPHWADKLYLIKMMLMCIITSYSKLKDTVKKAKALEVGQDDDNPQSLLKSITDCDVLMRRLILNHSVTTVASTSTQFIAMTILLEGGSEFTSETCNEISILLSSGDVLSAEVPQCLARLARQLERSRLRDEFREQDPRHALRWLKINLPHVYLDICAFLEQHGYRAIMEFDLYTKPWVLAPEDMMKVLQNLRASKEEEVQQSKTTSEIVASLKTPKKDSTRRALRWVLPLCRRSVRHREGTKAHLILTIHKLRLAFLRLGDMLVRQWYLPHRDLIFFFRLAELQKYIDTRDPALLKKAVQRHQCYPNWCKLKFAEINTGWVKPLESKGPLVTTGDVKLQATSVCGGEIIARACVVKDLAEVDQLRQGDVLITHATDIGWSPYFPLLTGIVTELGGLISHGAVIAREYGLPCIVGATEATLMFKTGDTVRLSGTNGTIEKVQIERDIECET